MDEGPQVGVRRTEPKETSVGDTSAQSKAINPKGKTQENDSHNFFFKWKIRSTFDSLPSTARRPSFSPVLPTGVYIPGVEESAESLLNFPTCPGHAFYLVDTRQV